MSAKEQLDLTYTELFTLYGEYVGKMKELDGMMANGWSDLVEAEREGRGLLDVSTKAYNLEDSIACTAVTYSTTNENNDEDSTGLTIDNTQSERSTSLSLSLVSDCDVRGMTLATRTDKTKNTSATKDTQSNTKAKPAESAPENPDDVDEVPEADEPEQDEEDRGSLRQRGAKAAAPSTTVSTAPTPSPASATPAASAATTAPVATPVSLSQLISSLTRVPPVPLVTAQQSFVDAARLAADIASLRSRLVTVIGKAEDLRKEIQ